ncbi:MAG: glycosyltransferase, partial [Bacteroidota bacterium]
MSESSSFYFSKYENRKPYEPIQISKSISLVYKLFLFLTLVSGFIYIFNRWIYSINGNSPGFSFVLLAAETLCYVGTLLSLLSLWDYKDSVAGLPVHMLSEIVEVEKRKDRPITIDVFIASYNEDADLVRLTINDAKKMKYPFPDVSVEIYLLDDGRRDGRNPNSVNLKAIALQEHVNYLTRDSNEGYKAGNLANGLMHTNGDLFLILDADTRVFPTFLEDTTGYFRNKNLAWVQT